MLANFSCTFAITLSARVRLASKEPVTVTWCDEVRRRFRRRLRPSRGDSLVHRGRSGLFLPPELHCIPANSHRPAGAGTQYACFGRQAIVLWFNRFTDLKWAGMGFACFGRQAVIQRLNSFTGLKWADMGSVCFCRQIIGRWRNPFRATFAYRDGPQPHDSPEYGSCAEHLDRCRDRFLFRWERVIAALTAGRATIGKRISAHRVWITIQG
jgi:hypothetical protein